MSDIGAEVRSAILKYTSEIIEKTATGELDRETAASDIAIVMDMAVRRDVNFRFALDLPEKE